MSNPQTAKAIPPLLREIIYSWFPHPMSSVHPWAIPLPQRRENTPEQFLQTPCPPVQSLHPKSIPRRVRNALPVILFFPKVVPPELLPRKRTSRWYSISPGLHSRITCEPNFVLHEEGGSPVRRRQVWPEGGGWWWCWRGGGDRLHVGHRGDPADVAHEVEFLLALARTAVCQNLVNLNRGGGEKLGRVGAECLVKKLRGG